MLKPLPHHALPGLWLVVAGLGVAASSAHAEDNLFYAPPPAADESSGISGKAELGYTSLSGNSNSETLLAKGSLSWYTGPWTRTLRAETKRVEDSGNVSTEEYLLGARQRLSLEGPHYLFNLARWNKERFSGYDYQATVIAGYGRQILDSSPHHLSLETGPGYRRDAWESGSDRDLLVAYGALDYEYELSESATFEQQLSTEATIDNVISRSYSAISVPLNDNLALKFSHEIKNNSNPPDEADVDTDTTTAASILYNF
ncbi:MULTISPECIES: DUF481 domain-containing protein [Larsenimonas]|uniref:DUF481 domain-containing protein n=1 Tax=Larsenimonas suaedae TaxID=1851019 RepID=A0ABU1GSG5_9GAMM|nr:MULTISPECIES: DUF481 domain-containing protein [Larsenimonas]MCM2972280.1 DUF481 domain-containing protein [Larsenimonas suaedae]MCM5704156.1 DUF481 domain-containing protein [Larsenimonas salina]MDR5894924.1 DUF481 domain-containing protein [Larsenimonas suaedae]